MPYEIRPYFPQVGNVECVQWLVKNTSSGRDKLNSKEADRQRSLLHTASKYGQVRSNTPSVITSRMHDSMLAGLAFMPTHIRLRKHVQACCRKELNETKPGSRKELHKLAFTVALAATFLPLPHTRQVSFHCAPMPESR